MLPAKPLTRRQKEILRLVEQGLTTPEIATKFGLSPRTVENHRAQILKRLRARSSIELVGRKSSQRTSGGSLDAPSETLELTAQHLRAACALLGWTLLDLIRLSGLPQSDLERLEDGLGWLRPETLPAVVRSLENVGITFYRRDGLILIGHRPGRVSPAQVRRA